MVCTCRDLWWLVEMCVPQRTANAPPRVTGRLLRAWATIEQPAGHLSSDLINFWSRTGYWWLCENSSNWWYLAQCSVKQYPTPLPCLDLLAPKVLLDCLWTMIPIPSNQPNPIRPSTYSIKDDLQWLINLSRPKKTERQKDRNIKRQKYEKTEKLERLNCISANLMIYQVLSTTFSY